MRRNPFLTVFTMPTQYKSSLGRFILGGQTNVNVDFFDTGAMRYCNPSYGSIAIAGGKNTLGGYVSLVAR